MDAGLSSQVDGTGIARLDFDLSLPLQRGSAPRLTFETGLFSFIRDGRNPHETYAALSWDGWLQAGVVRPAYDAVVPSVFAHLAPRIEDKMLDYTHAYTTTRALRETAVPWGLRVDGRSGTVGWAVSLHDAAKGDFRSASASATWDRGAWRVSGAVEGVWRRDSGRWDGANVKLGVRREGPKMSGGLSYHHPRANSDPDALELDLHLRAASPRLVLDFAAHIEPDGPDDIFGLGATWSLTQHDRLHVFATTQSGKGGVYAGLEHRF